MPETPEPAPLYQRVKSHISEKIHSGELLPNQRVPSEHELVRQLGVSRMTANRALRELTTEGLLTRVPGVGTFVARTQTTGHLLQVRSIAEEVRERGHLYSFQVFANKRARPPKAVAEWMGLESGASAFHTVLVHKETDIPIQVEDRYVNPESAPVYAGIDLEQTTPGEFLLNNVPLQRVEHTVSATMPSAEIRRILDMDERVPCLILERKTWSQGLPVSFVRLYHPGDKFVLSDSFTPRRNRGS